MNMETPVCDLTIKGGEDFSFSFFLKEEDGTLQDLTGKTYESQLRSFAEDSKAIDFNCSHNNQGGCVTISMPHQKTTGIRFESGVYDIIQINQDGTRECKLSGKVKIKPAVTR